MKKIILTAVVLTGFFLQAQPPIEPLFLKGKTIEGIYYKDMDNDFDNFVGTWKYTNATDTLIIKIEKREQVYRNLFNHYRDILVGEYRYVKNGVEKVNTLSLLGSPSITDFYDHNISGSSIMRKRSIPICEECAENERRVMLHFDDPTRPSREQGGATASIFLRRVNEGGTAKLKMLLRQTSSYIPPLGSNPSPEDYYFNVPSGNYTLIKVN